jgi:hypothetical protein
VGRILDPARVTGEFEMAVFHLKPNRSVEDGLSGVYIETSEVVSISPGPKLCSVHLSDKTIVYITHDELEELKRLMQEEE